MDLTKICQRIALKKLEIDHKTNARKKFQGLILRKFSHIVEESESKMKIK